MIAFISLKRLIEFNNEELRSKQEFQKPFKCQNSNLN